MSDYVQTLQREDFFMTSFLRTRKDRQPKPESKSPPRFYGHDEQSGDNQHKATNRQEIQRAYQDLKEGQVDTDLHGSGGLDEINKDKGKPAHAAPRKPDPDKSYDKTH